MALSSYPKKSKYTIADHVFYLDGSAGIIELIINQVRIEVTIESGAGVQKNFYKFSNDTREIEEGKLYSSKNHLTSKLKAGYLNTYPFSTGIVLFDLSEEDFAGYNFNTADFSAGGFVPQNTHTIIDNTNFYGATMHANYDTLSELITYVKSYDENDSIFMDGRPFGRGSYVRLNVKILLQGPYNTSSNEMEVTINGDVPAAHPYETQFNNYDGNESFYGGSNPSGDIVDWVYVELRSTATGAPVAQRVGYLLKDGTIAEMNTAYKMRFNVAPGSYYIVIGHRNHLAVMSAAAVSMDAEGTSQYDFSTGTNKYYGSDAALLETGVYGMYAGDANGNGSVDYNDYNAVTAALTQTGYKNEDINLSGIVTSGDYTLINANLGKTSGVPNLY